MGMWERRETSADMCCACAHTTTYGLSWTDGNAHAHNRYQDTLQTLFKFESFLAPSLLAKEGDKMQDQKVGIVYAKPRITITLLSLLVRTGERKGWSRRMRRKSQERKEKGERHDTFVCIPRMYGTRCVGCTTKKGGRKGVCFH